MESYVHYYYGDGKGKTTAAIGLAIRASNQGKVLYCQFLKKATTNEIAVLKNITNIEVLVLDWNYPFTFLMTPEQLETAKMELVDYFASIKETVATGGYQMVVLDEIGDAIALDLMGLEEVLDFLETRPKALEVVMTGHQNIEGWSDLIDYQTFMKKEKHPYDRGVPARNGVEF